MSKKPCQKWVIINQAMMVGITHWWWGDTLNQDDGISLMEVIGSPKQQKSRQTQAPVVYLESELSSWELNATLMWDRWQVNYSAHKTKWHWKVFFSFSPWMWHGQHNTHQHAGSLKAELMKNTLEPDNAHIWLKLFYRAAQSAERVLGTKRFSFSFSWYNNKIKLNWYNLRGMKCFESPVTGVL